VYLESGHGAGGKAIEVIAAMPSPDVPGTIVNSKYGDGVLIKRMEGTGNGGNFLQISKESEEEALKASNNYVSSQPIYEKGGGPVTIKVIDPLKIEPGNYSIYLKPDYSQPGPYELDPAPGDKGTRLI